MKENTHISSSGSFLSAFLAIHWKASSTLNPSFAEVSKYGMFPLEAHHALAFFSETCNQKTKNHVSNSSCIAISITSPIIPKSSWLNSETTRFANDKDRSMTGGGKELTTRLFPPSTSILFPNTTNGKFSGSEGLA